MGGREFRYQGHGDERCAKARQDEDVDGEVRVHALLRQVRLSPCPRTPRLKIFHSRLEEGSPPEDYWAAWNGQRFNPNQMLEHWVNDHRKKFVPLD